MATINPGLQFAATPEELAQRQALQNVGMQQVLQQQAVPVERPHVFSVPTHGVQNDFVTAHVPMQQAAVPNRQGHWGAVSATDPYTGIFITPTQRNNWDGVMQAFVNRLNTGIGYRPVTMAEAMKHMPKPPALPKPKGNGEKTETNNTNTNENITTTQQNNNVRYVQDYGFGSQYGGFDRPSPTPLVDSALMNNKLVQDINTGEIRLIQPTDKPQGTLTVTPMITPGDTISSFTVGNMPATGNYTSWGTGYSNETPTTTIGFPQVSTQTVDTQPQVNTQTVNTRPQVATTTVNTRPEYPGGTMDIPRNPRSSATYSFPLDESGANMLRGWNSASTQYRNPIAYETAIRALANSNDGSQFLRAMGIDPSKIDTSNDWLRFGVAALPTVFMPPYSYYSTGTGFGTIDDVNSFRNSLLHMSQGQRRQVLNEVAGMPYGPRIIRELNLPQ